MSNNKRDSELQGLSRLITDATIGVTDLVEAMHKRVVHPPLLPSTPIQNLISKIAGIVYQNIRWSTRFIGRNTDKALGQLASVIGEIKTSDEREAIRSILNGIIGDYLEKTENPLKITMQLRHQGKVIPLDPQSLTKSYPTVNGKILLMVHGLCMNDIQWTRKEHNHGTALAKELGKTAIYLHYNSGRHISSNGQDFSALLEELVQQWPVPVEELTIIAHSMGGLVSRSALYYGQQKQRSWTTKLKKIIFLGTPHQGARLERAGNYLDVLLEAVPYAKPFARLTKIRSAGISDLRYGNLIEEDWEDEDRFEMQPDPRQHIPLPEPLSFYCIAAIIGETTDTLSSRLLGDQLVDVASALGKHKDPSKDLNLKVENTWITEETSHLDLLNKATVYSKIKSWLT